MNEEQIRRIIREEIRSALQSLAANAEDEYRNLPYSDEYETERTVWTSLSDLLSRGAFRLKYEEKR